MPRVLTSSLHDLPQRLLPFVALLLAVGLALYAVVVFLLARMLTRPPRMTDAKALYRLGRLSPEDLHLPHERLIFHVRDERTGQSLKLAAWWIPLPPLDDAGRGEPSAQHPREINLTPGNASPAPRMTAPDRTVVLIHGYADAKVGAIAWAPLFRDLGYNILAIDLRAHGDSDGADTTAGYFERNDVDQLLNQFKAQRPEETRHLVLFGISLGAAVASAVAALRDDLDAVILEGPYADFADAVLAHSDLMGMPGRAFVKPGYALAQTLTSADFNAVRPMDSIRAARCPVMVITGAEDPLIGPRADAQLRDAIASRPDSASTYWHVPAANHVLSFAVTPDEYEHRIAAFLSAAMASSASAPPTATLQPVRQG